MAWDFMRDLATGDWVLSGDRDYSGITGTMLIQQRVSINLKIHRGQFVYDMDKSLGSRLHELLHQPTERGISDAADIIREALAGMNDIAIDEIQIVVAEDDPRQLRARIAYHPVVPIDFATAPLEGGVVEIPFGHPSADLTPPEPKD